MTQQVAVRDDHVVTVFDRSRVELVLGHQRRRELIEIAVEPPMAPRPDLMHRSMPVPTTIEAGGPGPPDKQGGGGRLLPPAGLRRRFGGCPPRQKLSPQVRHP